MTIEIEVGLDEGRATFVTEHLIEYNDAHSPAMAASRRDAGWGRRELQAYAIDEDELIAGGITGHVRWHWLEIGILWVRDDLRRQGIGARLLEALEAQAKELGCTKAKLSTFEFQAPEFYQKLGWKIAGVVEDYPPGSNDYTLVKDLL